MSEYRFTRNLMGQHTSTAIEHVDAGHVWEEWNAYVSDLSDAPEYVDGDSTGIACHTCRVILVDVLAADDDGPMTCPTDGTALRPAYKSDDYSRCENGHTVHTPGTRASDPDPVARTSAPTWVDSTDVQVGDVIVPRFGADRAPVTRIEDVRPGFGRLRFFHADGSTTRSDHGERVCVRREVRSSPFADGRDPLAFDSYLRD